jgi:hypothetical protein
VRVSLVRADSGFCTRGMIAELEARSLHYIMTAALRAPVRTLCRHDDTAWTPTGVPGIEVQEVAHQEGRLVVLRQRVGDRPNAGGKKLLEVPGYKFQALRTNLSAALGPSFQIVVDVELGPNFADEWQARHPDAMLTQLAARLLYLPDLLPFDLLVAGVPCTSHSNLGRGEEEVGR